MAINLNLADLIYNLGEEKRSRRIARKIKNDLQLSFNLLEKNREKAKNLSGILRLATEQIRNCNQCRNLTEQSICNICSDEKRDQNMLCIVENPSDVLAIENSGTFKGKYFVLMGRLSPIDGVSPEDLGIPDLLRHIKGAKIEEVILATSSTVEGDATASFINDHLDNVKVSRISYGIPIGGELEYVDGTTIARAIEGRVEINVD